jgi:RimJ/RimL family protein N-acetyltransferase
MTSGVFESVKVTAPRLMLRNLMKADVPALFDVFSHLEVMRYWSSPALSEAVQAQEMLAQIQEGYQSDEVSDSALYGLLRKEWT